MQLNTSFMLRQQLLKTFDPKNNKTKQNKNATK